MFSKKPHVDVKKSTIKVQDVKKDSATRFKHLKIVLDNVDVEEAKGFFEGNFSHVYYILYDCFVTAETNLRQRDLSFHLVHKAHREELEQVLQLLEKVLTLLPELLNRRWQCHSLATILYKLLHPANSWKLRKQAIRYFVLWYQALGENAPDNIHQMFTSLIPGFPPRQASPYKFDRKSDAKKDRHNRSMSYDEKEKKELYEAQFSQCSFHDSCVPQGPASPPEIVPILLPLSGEKPLDNETLRLFESLLEYMVTEVVKLEWRDKQSHQNKCFQFLLDRFKSTYLKYICPEFDPNFTLYKPNLELPTMRKPPPQSQGDYVLCKVALIKWIATFTHVAKQEGTFTPNSMLSPREGDNHLFNQNQTDSGASSANPSSLQDLNQEDITLAAMTVAREVFYSSRENVNFIHEMYRQAFLLDFAHAGAIRKAIGAYKDWIQMNEIPPFMLEPLDGYRDKDYEESLKKPYDADKSPQDNTRPMRLKNNSFADALNRESLFVRTGLQNVLQVFITQASNVFFLDNPAGTSPTLLEEQTDSCKRVLNVYRYVVMHTRLESATWEQLLRILLQITVLVLSDKKSRRKIQDTIGGKLAPAIFQTLIVTWIKANLNVVISTQLWDQFLEVLTSLTYWEELIREWAKTLDTLTRVLARHVYNLDLNDLPLDRLSEQKSKKRRGVSCRTSVSGGVQVSRRSSADQTTMRSPKEPTDNSLTEIKKSRPMIRSISENSIYHSKIRSKLHKQKVVTGLTNIPVLPSTIEQDMAKLSLNSFNVAKHIQKSKIRRTKSLDSIAINDSEPSSPRCPSPTLSSGVDSNKDSPIQIENIDGSSIEASDASEKRSVMAGGSVRGWLPDVAVVLWRRMLSALGDINNIQNPVLHSQVFDYLVQLSHMLIKIRLNQGVSGDNLETLSPPDLIPPLTIIAPWCFKAIQLPEQYESGKLSAYRLICLMTIRPQDVSLPKQHLVLFIQTLHDGISSNNPKIVQTIIKYSGPRLFSVGLPGYSLLILDFVQAANFILSSQDLQAPRMEAVSILGTLLSIPIPADTRMLKPYEQEIVTVSCPNIKDSILSILMRCCRREPTGVARCIALSSLATFIYRQLCCKTQHNSVPEAINIILLSLKTTHATVAQVACDCLLLFCDKVDYLQEIYPDMPSKIVQSLSETLQKTLQRKTNNALTVSMLFCLGEWAMHLGPDKLLQVFQGKRLLLTVFNTLYKFLENKPTVDPTVPVETIVPENEDFDPLISLDNLINDSLIRNPRHENFEAVQLAAKTIIMHLVNNLGHFPMGIGASRLSSLVVEQDDVPGMESNEISTAMFHAPNIQSLLLSNSTIMSLIELDALDLPGGGVTAGLTTAPSMVRVLLRDLAGKACWDASILYNQPTDQVDAQIPMLKTDIPIQNERDDLCSVLPQPNCPRRHTMRRREPDVLPTFENAADDMDNLDDLLQYIGHTSPEVLEDPERPLNFPAPPPAELQNEAETIALLLNQRNSEREYLKNWCYHPSMCARPIKPPISRPPQSPFHHCRLLFSHLGLSGWEQRKKLHLLSKNEKLIREIRNLDGQRSRETHKMAVIYVAHGQEDKNSVLNNINASKEYESFIARLAWEVELESHTGFMGGLVPGKASGVTAPYWATSFTEVLFHVATRMPSDSHESLLQKTRHLGNDEIHIVWSEHWRDYRRETIPTEFCDVLIVIYPLQNKLYRIQVSCKPEVPFFGLLFDECVVEDAVLPGVVRATALAASRAKRSTLSLYQQYYEERAKCIDMIVKNHKESTTFEEFASHIISPVQPTHLFSGPSSMTGSTASVQSVASSNLASALIDSQQNKPGFRSNSVTTSEAKTSRVSEISRVWFNTEVQEGANFHGISPRPYKKMSSKPGLKSKVASPPESPKYK